MTRPAQMQLFGENWITGDCVFAVSTGIATAKYLYDQKPATKWVSLGSSDGTAETITVTFYNIFGLAATQTIDRVILLNTNAKSITVTTKLGATVTAFGSATGAAATVVITGAAISCDSITITITTTQTANEEKYVGELKACLYLMTVNATTELSRQDDWRAGSFRVRSGALVRWREYTKAAASETISNLAPEQRDILIAAIAQYAFLTLYFYGDFAPSEIYEYAVTEAPTEGFNRLTMLYSMELKLQER